MELEEAIGAVALYKLRDWLNSRYPPHIQLTNTRHPVHPIHGEKYHVVHYQDTIGDKSRTWWKVVETATGLTAVWRGPGVKSKLGLKQDYFMSHDEAFRAIDRLS